MKNAIVIVNPNARSGGGASEWEVIEENVRKAFPNILIERTQGPQHATQLARQAVENGIINIFAAGGDGTIHEVVNGIIKDDKSTNSNITFGVIGIGTGCDTFRSMGISLDPIKQIEVIKNGKTRFFDVGKVEMVDQFGHPRIRYFFNGSSFGMGASVMNFVNKSEKRWGTLGFLIPSLKAYKKFQPCRVLLTFDNRMTVEKDVMNVTICNGPYSGSGMRWTKQSKMDDGIFEVITIQRMSAWKVLIAVPMLYLGTLPRLKEVDIYKVKELKVTGDRPLPIECEGEEPGTLPATFSVLPNALRVFVP